MVTAKRSKPSLFRFVNRAALAAALGLGLAACDGLVEGSLTNGSECGSDASGNFDCNGQEGPEFTRQTDPTGTITGSAIDSNGNPIAGATVVVAGLPAVTTDSAGQFRVEGVNVAGTFGNVGNGGANGTGNFGIPVSIQAAGYAGATLSVDPRAQLSSDGTVGNNPQVVLVDGFQTTVGNVILPAEDTRATGVLLDGNTGQPMANQVLTFDFLGVQLDQTPAGAGVPVGVVIGYQDSNTINSTTTDANGEFTIDGLIADACYRLQGALLFLRPGNAPATSTCAAPNAAPAAGTVNFNTNNEATQTAYVGQVLGNVVSLDDITNPYVIGVNLVLDGTTNPGQMVQVAGGVQSFTITLSEPTQLTAGTVLSTSEVVVTAGGSLNPVLIASTATVVDSRTLQIDLAAPLGDGVTFNVDLLSTAFVDTAGNVLALNAQNAANAQGGGTTLTGGAGNQGNANVVPPVNYDLTNGASTRLVLRTFSPLDSNTDAGSIAQVSTPVNPSTDNVFAVTTAMSDFVTNDADLPNYLAAGRMLTSNAGGNAPTLVALNPSNRYEQLNSIDPRVDPATSTPTALNNLLDILENGFITGQPNGVHARTVTADVTFGTANHYLAWVEDQTGNIQNVNLGVFPVNATSNPRVVGTLAQFNDPSTVPAKSYSSALAQQPGCAIVAPATSGAGPCAIYVVAKGGASNALMVIQDTGTNTLAPGMTLHLISRTASGFTGNEQVVTLADTVAPTVGAQFFAGTAGAIASVNSSSSASGGTTINLVTATGEVIYPITPQAWEVTEEAAPNLFTGLSGDTFTGAGEFEALSNAALRAAGVQGRLNVHQGGAPVNAAIADATGMEAFLAATTRGLGLIVTEASQIVSGAAATQDAGSTAVLSNYSVVQNAIDELTNPVHLLAFNSDVRALETDGRATRSVDFSPVFTDRAAVPNQAQGASAQLRDFTPPMMTRAFFDGSIFVFEFHEGISTGEGTATPDIWFDCGLNIDIDAVAANASVTFNADRTRITVPLNVVVNNVTQQNPAIAGVAAANIGGTCFPENAVANASNGTNPAYAETAYTLANVQAAGSQLSTVAAAPIHTAVFYGFVRDQANNTDIGGQNGNDWSYWSLQGLGHSNVGVSLIVSSPAFAAANVIPPFSATMQCFNFVAGSGAASNPGQPGQQFSCDVTFTGPVFLSDLTANGALGLANDVNNLDADDGPSGGMNGGVANDGIVSQGELTAYMASKFEAVTSGGAVKANLISATMKRVVGGVASATFGNDGTVLTLTFQIGGTALVSGDRVQLISGGGIATPPLSAGNETSSQAISGAISPGTQFIIRNDGAGQQTNRELAPVQIP